MADINKATAIISIILLAAIYLFICTPFTLYYTFKLYLLNKSRVPFIVKRHPLVVIIMVTLFAIYPIFIRPIADITLLNDPYHAPSRISINFMLLPTAFICIRLWLLYFDYKRELQTVDQKWKICINQTIKPWTQKCACLGYPKLIMFMGIFSVMICIGINALFAILKQLIIISYTQMLPGLYILFIIIMLIKIRKCRDSFHIRSKLSDYTKFFIKIDEASCQLFR